MKLLTMFCLRSSSPLHLRPQCHDGVIGMGSNQCYQCVDFFTPIKMVVVVVVAAAAAAAAAATVTVITAGIVVVAVVILRQHWVYVCVCARVRTYVCTCACVRGRVCKYGGASRRGATSTY